MKTGIGKFCIRRGGPGKDGKMDQDPRSLNETFNEAIKSKVEMEYGAITDAIRRMATEACTVQGTDSIGNPHSSERDDVACTPSQRAMHLERMSDHSPQKKEFIARLASEHSELVKRERELSRLGMTGTDEYRTVMNELRENETDMEYVQGVKDILQRDAVYKDLSGVPKGGISQRRVKRWSGEAGNSKGYCDDPEVRKLMEQYGQDYVECVNNNPDFRAFTKHYSEELGYFDGEVAIHHMKGDVDTFGNEIDARELNESCNPEEDCMNESDLGNYAQADRMLATRLGRTQKDIREYRKKHGLTWHECADGVTMQLIPTAIHNYYRHEGGVFAVKTDNRETREIGYLGLRTKSGQSIGEKIILKHYKNERGISDEHPSAVNLSEDIKKK